jgi:hypothetical protein
MSVLARERLLLPRDCYIDYFRRSRERPLDKSTQRTLGYPAALRFVRRRSALGLLWQFAELQFPKGTQFIQRTRRNP